MRIRLGFVSNSSSCCYIIHALDVFDVDSFLRDLNRLYSNRCVTVVECVFGNVSNRKKKKFLRSKYFRDVKTESKFPAIFDTCVDCSSDFPVVLIYTKSNEEENLYQLDSVKPKGAFIGQVVKGEYRDG
jgi:hypothetical protein